MKRLTTEEFIEKARMVHGDKYDYSLVEYVNNKSKVKIICPEHGMFEQMPIHHIRGANCNYCVNNIQKTIEQFIKESKEIHGNKYDYSLVEYKNNKTKVKIICPEHGMFEQTPNSHLKGNGCKKCSDKYRRTKKDDFIKRANKIHNNIYDYNGVIYVNTDIKVKIYCSIHNYIFEQSPHAHLRGNACPKCSKSYKRTEEEFIQESKNIHDDKYDYSLIDYKNNRTKIKIICPKHGIWEQQPYSHLNGHGCCYCKESQGEKDIFDYLNNNGILFERQKRFNDCRNINPLPFDFYLPNKNILIEYDGELHFKSIDYFGGKKSLLETQKRDKIKNQYCKDNNIPLYRIKYDENTIERLDFILKKEGIL